MSGKHDWSDSLPSNIKTGSNYTIATTSEPWYRQVNESADSNLKKKNKKLELLNYLVPAIFLTVKF